MLAFLVGLAFLPVVLVSSEVNIDNLTNLLLRLESLLDAYSIGEDAKSWLETTNREFAQKNEEFQTASWNYDTDLTEDNAKLAAEAEVKYETWVRKKSEEASRFDVSAGSDDLARQLEMFSKLSAASKNGQKLKQLSDVKSQMVGIYGKATVCRTSTDDCLPLESDLEDIMATSRDVDELLWAWQGWRNVTGVKVKDMFKTYVDLSNEGAKEHGYDDIGEFWRSSYDVSNFDIMIDNLYEEIRPLYEDLHTFVRMRLRDFYGEKLTIGDHDPIPAHLLGNMWAQEWDNIIDIVKPFPSAAKIDVTSALIGQNYTVEAMFRLAEEFFKSLGLPPMTNDFWANSVMKKPPQDVVCHASAWDFHNGHDYRIKMCTKVTSDDLWTIHHEMGHIQYFMAYSHQPDIFRDGANPGFHEALGDTIALSAAGGTHLSTIGLVDESMGDEQSKYENGINELMEMALRKIAFLPFGYILDKWRWEVFRGNIHPADYNRQWWQMRLKYQGLSPPVTRTDADFDPGAKYHVISDVPYVRYFVSFLLQFQFYESLCEESGHTGPLHTCDFYRSQEAGTKLINMLKLGSSKPWPEVLQQMTGSREIQTASIQRYFKPLTDWIQKQIKDSDKGWTTAAGSLDKYFV